MILSVWPSNCTAIFPLKFIVGMKLKSIIQFLHQLNSAQRQLYTEVLKLAKFILVMPATNAAASERTFSALRRLKTWLRSTMHASG